MCRRRWFSLSACERSGLALGIVAMPLLAGCDPFPLSELGPVPEALSAGAPASYSVTAEGLAVLPAADAGRFSVVQDGLRYGQTACSDDERVCVVGGVIR